MKSKTIITKSDRRKKKQQINLTKIYVDETCWKTAGVFVDFSYLPNPFYWFHTKVRWRWCGVDGKMAKLHWLLITRCISLEICDIFEKGKRQTFDKIGNFLLREDINRLPYIFLGTYLCSIWKKMTLIGDVIFLIKIETLPKGQCFLIFGRSKGKK